MVPEASTHFVIPQPPVVSVPVAGTLERFPVRRVYCVGRNYADHAREMGHDPDREPPFFFTKAAQCLVTDGGVFPYPTISKDVHHEVELVVALKAGAANVDPADALALVYGYAVGIDFTRRDMQAQAKAKGHPWEMSKSFDHAAAIGALAPVDQIGHPASGRIWFEIDGDLRQDGQLDQMIWSVPEVLSHLSHMVTLAPGDLIYTGTPAGVSAVERGNKLVGRIDGVGSVETAVV